MRPARWTSDQPLSDADIDVGASPRAVGKTSTRQRRRNGSRYGLRAATGQVRPGSRTPHAEPRRVQRGQEHERQHRRDHEAAHHRDRHRPEEVAARRAESARAPPPPRSARSAGSGARSRRSPRPTARARPRCRWSIWSTRMTELRMMMPGQRDRAEHRDEAERLAEREQRERRRRSGRAARSARPSAVREKLCSWIISSVSTTMTSSGMPAAIDFWPRAESSIAPPDLDPVAERQRGAQRRRAAARCGCATSGPCASPRTSARTVIVGSRLRRQTMPSSSS